MAAAEARAGWQRTANRCFVQEDARGAPKLSQYPSSSSTSVSDSNLGDATKRSDHPIRACMPHNQNCSNPDLLNDTKWWLHLQPNRGHLINFSQKQLNGLEAEVGVLRSGSVNQTVKFIGENRLMEEYDIQSYSKSDNAGSFVGQPCQAFPAYMKDDQHGIVQEFEAVIDGDLQKTPTNKDMGEFWCAEDHLLDLELCNCVVSETPKKRFSELESHWVGIEKTGPWWRTADKDELASLVSHKSLEYFENCDLPRPHSKHFGRGASACPQCFDQHKVLASLDQKVEKEISNLDDYMRETPTSISMGRTQCTLGGVGLLPHVPDRPFSRNDSISTTKVDDEEILQRPNSELSKAQLLEALRHSQTRAREAEKAAQHAFDEKEHIIKLFFRQASHLFAYKQWLQILQLETICLQLRNNQPVKGTQLRKGTRKDAKKKKLGQPPPRCKGSKCAVAFAVGLSLAGAGLLLGWTMGWLFPAF